VGYLLRMHNLRTAIWLLAYLAAVPVFLGSYGLSFKFFADQFGAAWLLLIAPAHVVIWLTILWMLDTRNRPPPW